MIVAARIPLTLALAVQLTTVLGCASGRSAAPSRDAALAARHEAAPVAEESTSRVPGAALASSVNATRRPWRFEGEPGFLLKTPHYRIYTTVPDTMLDRVGRFYEQALVHYMSALTSLPEPTSPLETYLFNDRHQWRAKTRQMLPEQAKTFLTLGRGGLTTRGVSVLYDIGPRGTFRDTFAIAAHEGWHQYTQRVFKQHLPIWLEEGIATYMEGYRESSESLRFHPRDNPERRRTLRKAVHRDRLIPLDELLSRSPQSFLNEGKEELLTYYAQVWALTHFLIEGEGGRYRGRLTKLLLDACRGRLELPAPSASDTGTGAAACIREYFKREPEAFRREYQRFIDQLTRRGGWQGWGTAAVN